MPEPDDYTDILDPYTLTRPEPVIETRTFTNEMRRTRMTLTFKAESDYSLLLRIQRRAQELIQVHIHGKPLFGPDGKPTGRRSVAAIRPMGNRLIEPDPELLYRIAVLESLHCPPEGTRKFDVHQWSALSVADIAMFTEINDWAAELLERASAEPDKSAPVPNESGAVTENIFGSPVTNAP